MRDIWRALENCGSFSQFAWRPKIENVNVWGNVNTANRGAQASL